MGNSTLGYHNGLLGGKALGDHLEGLVKPRSSTTALTGKQSFAPPPFENNQ